MSAQLQWQRKVFVLFFFMWRIKLWEISKDSSEVRHCSQTCEVICSLSGLLKRDSCSSVRMAFSHVSSPEAITRGGRWKAPAEKWKALWHRRIDRETRGVQVQIFFLSILHSVPCSPPQRSLYRKLYSIWATTNPCMTSVPISLTFVLNVSLLF